jgi:hypothetical protein
MAGHAIHIIFCRMHIAQSSHTIIFIADTAAVASGALVERVRTLLEDMAVDKTFFSKFRSADMTAAAAGMTGITMVLPCRIDLRPFIHVRPGFKNRCEWCKGYMQRILCRCNNFFVAFAAGSFRVVLSRVGIQACMRRLFVSCGSIAAMAVSACYFSMLRVKKCFSNQNFLKWLQRNHGTTSAGSGLHRGFLPGLRGYVLLEHFLVQVTGYTS